MSKTERAIQADLTERRTLLLAERDRALASVHALTGALNEIERLLAGFDGPEDLEHLEEGNDAGPPDLLEGMPADDAAA